MPNRPRSTITRQLTEEEEALEERASPFLKNATPEPRSFASSDDRYLWMKRDLEMRDMQARAMQNESQLAGGFGDKRAIAAENTKETEQDIADQRGLDLFSKKIASGIHPNQAQQEVNQELGLELSEGFNTRAVERAKTYETPDAQKTRERKELLEKAGIGKKEFDAKVVQQLTEGEPAIQEAVRTQRLINQANEVGAKNSLAAKQIEDLDDDWRLSSAKKNAEDKITYGDGSLIGAAKLASSFANSGLGAIEDKAGLVRDFSGEQDIGVLQALSDDSFINDYHKDDPKGTAGGLTSMQKKANFSKAINDWRAKEPDAVKDPTGHAAWQEKKNVAEGIVYEFLGKHANDRDQMMRRQEKAKADVIINKAMEVSNKATGEAFQEASKRVSLNHALKAKDGKSAPDAMRVNGMTAAGRTFLAMARATNGGSDEIYLRAKQDLENMLNDSKDPKTGKTHSNYLKNPDGAVNEVNRIMGKYLIDQRNFLSDGTMPKYDDDPNDEVGKAQAEAAEAEAKLAAKIEADKAAPAATPAVPGATPAAAPAPATPVVQPVPIPDDKRAAAIDWLKKNPTHPNAANVKARLGIP